MRGALETAIYQQALRAITARDDEASRTIATELAAALAQDELHAPLAPKLADLAQRATRILAEVKPREAPVAAPHTPPPGLTGLGIEYDLVAEGATRTVADLERELGRMREALAKAGTNARVELSWKVRAPKGWKA